jgi:hypothetical protein
MIHFDARDIINNFLKFLFLISLVLPVEAQKSIVPLIDVATGCLLGGAQAERYHEAKTVYEKIKGVQKYLRYDWKGQSGELNVKIKSPCMPCEDFYFYEPKTNNQKGVAIGANCTWNPLPRTYKFISLKNKTYLQIISNILQARGMKNATPIIKQAIRVDLDGDRMDEVLLAAHTYDDKMSPGASANNYSFVVLRKIVAGKVKNIFLSEEYVKKPVKFGAFYRFEISSVLDLNGDGKLEIIVNDEYYEGCGARVFEVKDDNASEVKMLECGCGL